MGDSLLLSGSSQGFTGVIFRDKHPLIVRTVTCGHDEFEDEFYRFLLFYRDRSAPEGAGNGAGLARLMVIGEGITKQRAGEIVNETTGGDLRVGCAATARASRTIYQPSLPTRYTV